MPTQAIQQKAPTYPDPLKALETIKEFKQLKSSFFASRFSKNWKVTLMEYGTVIAIAGFAITFFTHSVFTAIIFLPLAVASGVATFYMRQFEDLKSLEESSASLQRSERRFKKIATDLETENGKLKKTSLSLKKTNQSFKKTNADLKKTSHSLKKTNDSLEKTNQDLQETNGDLQETNEALQETNRSLQETAADLRQTNAALNQEVTKLSLEVTNLQQCTTEIREGIAALYGQNTAFVDSNRIFKWGLGKLHAQLENTDALHQQISQRIDSQQNTLEDQLVQLREYLETLRSQDGLIQQIEGLRQLKDETAREVSLLRKTEKRLNKVQTQFAAERGKFEAIQEALEQVRAELSHEVGDFRANNQLLQGTGEKLRQGVARLEALAAGA